MIKHGQEPYLECSTKGDRRFSAFWASPKSLKGRSIEQAYQAMKIHPDGTSGHGWTYVKGKRAVNMGECQTAYKQWWKEWVEDQELMPVLLAASGLSDMFGRRGTVCQATVLWEMREREG